MQGLKFIFLFFILTGCLFQKHEGVMLQESDIAKIHTGQSAVEVRQIIGTPSFIIANKSGNEEWFYLSSKKEWRAFFEPKTTEQLILQIEFAKGGTSILVNKITELPNENLKQPKTKIKQPAKP